jgi:uncharacterized protein YjbJ (UPF0337 family)
MKTYNEAAKSSTTDKIEGNAKVAAGAVKEQAGKAFRSPNLQERGIDEKNEGRVQKMIGEVKKSFNR